MVISATARLSFYTHKCPSVVVNHVIGLVRYVFKCIPNVLWWGEIRKPLWRKRNCSSNFLCSAQQWRNLRWKLFSQNMYTKKYKLIQKGIELTRAKFSAPYFPDNCNISSLREKQNFNLSILTYCVHNYPNL